MAGVWAQKMRFRRFVNHLRLLPYDPTKTIGFLICAALAYLILAPVLALLLDTVRVNLRDSAIIGLPTGKLTTYFLQRTFLSRVSDVLFWKPFWRTLWVAGAVCAIAIPMGALFAWIVVRTNLPGSKVVSRLMVVPYMIPSWTFAVAWISVFKNRRLGGLSGMLETMGFVPPDWIAYGALPIIVCESLHVFPFAFLLFGNALRSVDSQLEESARILGASSFTISRRIVLPLLKPALLSSFLLTFSRVLGSFGTPYILGSGVKYYLLPTALYNSYKVGSPGVAAVIACVTVLIGMSLVALDMFFVREYRRFITMGGKGAIARKHSLGALTLPAVLLTLIALCVTILVPLGTLILTTFMHRPGLFTVDNFTLAYWVGTNVPAMVGQKGFFLNRDILQSLQNSVWIAGSASLLCGLMGILVGYVVVRLPKSKVAAYLRQVSFLPYLIPSIGFAAASLSFFAVPRGPIPSLYGSMSLLILVMSLKYLPFASRSGISAMMQMGNEPEEAARICGATWLRRMGRIVLPLQKHALLTGVLLPLISGMKEQSLVIMLATPGTELMTTQILRFIDYGYTQLANATVVGIVGIIFILTFSMERLTGANLASGFASRG